MIFFFTFKHASPLNFRSYLIIILKLVLEYQLTSLSYKPVNFGGKVLSLEKEHHSLVKLQLESKGDTTASCKMHSKFVIR